MTIVCFITLVFVVKVFIDVISTHQTCRSITSDGHSFESDPLHYVIAGTTGDDCIGGCKLNSLYLSTRETMYTPFLSNLPRNEKPQRHF